MTNVCRSAVLQVATPEGDSGKVFASGGDYLFRYHEDAKAQAAISLPISLLMPMRLDEYRHRELHPIFQMMFQPLRPASVGPS